MRSLLVLLVMLVLVGCSQNHYNIPTQNLVEKVKVLGIAPIMVDAGSDIKHPQKDQLVSLLTDLNRRYEQQLVRKIRGTGSFYTVALLDDDPQRLFSSMLFRREKRDDATIQYNKYFWKNDELRNYLTRNRLDAVMFVVVSGLSKVDRVSSITLLSSLSTEYNFLVMTAQILDANGTILWEYPNFRRRILSYTPLLNLQYPDFSEAEANHLAKAEVKFKTLAGVRKALEQRAKDVLMREVPEPEAYGKQFDEMASFLKFEQQSGSQQERTPVERPLQRVESQKPAEPSMRPQPEIQAPAAQPAEQPKPAAPAAPATPAR